MSARYLAKYLPTHPNAAASGYVAEHVRVMSEKIGRPLNAGEVVHHKGNDSRNNHPDNLMLFSSSAEHNAHHARERAFLNCGNASFMKCQFCKEYDDPANMTLTKTGTSGACHKSCRTENQKARRALKKEKEWQLKENL